MNGIVNIYKEKGFTSHDVVAKLRGITRQKKIGHTGTLDPDATGVLPVCLGNATKLCDLLTDKDKTYEAVLLLGKETDTQDTTGKVLKECEVAVTEEKVKEVIASFIGDINQIPPMYSALKVNGKKLYELAREGKVVERRARPITIHDIIVKNITLNGEVNEVQMEVSCSKGTYIRTLCHDIGEALGCGGCMKSLVRTKVSQFTLADALTLTQVSELQQAGEFEAMLIPVEDMFPNYKKISVSSEGNRFLMNGNPLKKDYVADATCIQELSIGDNVRIYDIEGKFSAIYEWSSEKILKPVKMFLS